MKKFVPIAVAAMLVATTASIAQTAVRGGVAPSGTAKTLVDCEVNWKTSDNNSDGMIDSAEATASNAVIPISLAVKLA